MIIQEPVQAAIWHCLNHYDHKDAVFLSERLYAEVESDETILLLATSYYRSKFIHQAYWLLKEKGRHTPECRFLQAKCAYELEKYAEAECALFNSGFGEQHNFDVIAKDFGEIACFVFQLISNICIKTERKTLAIEALKRALKLNPFMWHTFTELCNVGEKPDAAAIFQINSTDIFHTCQSNANTSGILLNLTGGNGTHNDSSLLSFNTPLLTRPQGVSYGTAAGVLPETPSPCDPQQMQVSANNSLIQNLATPNNNSISLLRGMTPHQISGMTILEETPVGYTAKDAIVLNTAAAHLPQDTGAGTPFRKQFKYLQTFSPATPSFGVLPLYSPCGGAGVDSSFNSGTFSAVHMPASLQTANLNITNSPSPQAKLTEINKESKLNERKKMRSGHVSSLLGRRDSSGLNSAHKPAVFAQTGNVTPRTPSNISGISTAGAPNAVRRSSRLFSNTSYSVKENNKTPNINNKFVQPRSPPRKAKTRITKMCLNNELIEDKSNLHAAEKQVKKEKEKIETITSSASNNNNESRTGEDSKVLLNNSLNNAQTMAHHVLALKKQSADGLMSLLRDLGEAYMRLASFECKAAIQQLDGHIPKHQLLTSWVQSLIGLAHYELHQYEQAVSIFKDIHTRDPHRLEYMEIYSTCLWHLQREVDLSALAHDLVQQNRHSPITWCVSGNCFSLQKEHDTAIKYFRRAAQMDKDFVYSYTLLGHELVITEELDKAMDQFRAAVMRDPRHYNAWFGIGTIYSKQEKYELAELNFIKALKINPQNSVLLVHIGCMQFFMQKKELALQTLNVAASLDPKNPLARFHRGSIYFSLGKHDEALRELEELKEIVPKESVVFYLIGKIHKSIGNVDKALMYFSWATDLDPKGANNQVKDVFDSMSHTNCIPPNNETGNIDAEMEPVSERSDDSTQTLQDTLQDMNYDSDAY